MSDFVLKGFYKIFHKRELGVWFRVTGAMFIVLLTISIYCIYNAPVDYKQGEIARLIYVHVPAAWLSLGIYSIMAIFSAMYWITRVAIFSIIPIGMSTVGLMFSFICLVTGSIWGHSTWGTYWIWDARLTSMLVLFFTYLGYRSIQRMMDWDDRMGFACAIFNIVTALNVPIVKFSVNWWNTLHQPSSILRSGGIAIHTSMLIPLLLSASCGIAYCVMMTILNVNLYLRERKLLRLLYHK